ETAPDIYSAPKFCGGTLPLRTDNGTEDKVSTQWAGGQSWVDFLFDRGGSKCISFGALGCGFIELEMHINLLFGHFRHRRQSISIMSWLSATRVTGTKSTTPKPFSSTSFRDSR